MARPRFLDGLDPRTRAELEPELRRRIAAGERLDALLAWCHGEKVDVGRTALANFMREAKAGSGSAEDPALKLRHEMRAAAVDVSAPAPVVDTAADRDLKPENAGAPAGEQAAAEPEEEVDEDHGAAIRRQLKAARKSETAAVNMGDTKTAIAAQKLQADLRQQLRDYEREQQDPDKRPRIVFYFPERTAIERLESGEG